MSAHDDFPNGTQRDLGELFARVSALEDGQAAIGQKVDRLLALAERGTGALWLLLKLGALASAIVAAWAWIIQHLPK